MSVLASICSCQQSLQVLAGVQEVITEQLGVAVNEIKPEDKLSDLDADSLDATVLQRTLEEKYDVVLEQITPNSTVQVPSLPPPSSTLPLRLGTDQEKVCMMTFCMKDQIPHQ